LINKVICHIHNIVQTYFRDTISFFLLNPLFLGDASRVTNTWDKTAEFEAISKLPNTTNGEYESYMLQKKLPLKCEFRVHTFSKEIIPRLTYLMQGNRPNGNFSDAENFVNEVLQKLPGVILQGTLIAWDIALTDDDQYYIIEANFPGFHPEFRKGFQTSGFVDDHRYGAIICAWLNYYFYKTFGISVDAIEDSLFLNYLFYRSFIFYLSLFKKANIDLFIGHTNEVPFTFMIYLGEDTNILIVNLIKHFLLVDFKNLYCVIVRDEYFAKIRVLFTNE
jgi:hypothetical protein